MIHYEIQKLRYLKQQNNYSDTTIESIKTCFSTVSRVEESNGKDLSLFTQPEIIDMLKSINAKTRGYLTTICVYFADYYKWCFSEGLVTDPLNKYEMTWTKPIIEEIIPIEFMRGKYFPKNDLFEYLDNIKDPTNKFVTYALYSGVKGDEFEELINIKMNDLDKDSKELTLITGRKIQADDLFINLMEKANNATHYFVDGYRDADRIGYYEYVNSDYVLKQVQRGGKNAPITINTMINRIKVIKEQSGNDFLSVLTLYKNGLINYIIEQYAKMGVTFEKAMFDSINKKKYTYDEQTQVFINEYGSKMESRMLRREVKDYIDIWK